MDVDTLIDPKLFSSFISFRIPRADPPLLTGEVSATAIRNFCDRLQFSSSFCSLSHQRSCYFNVWNES